MGDTNPHWTVAVRGLFFAIVSGAFHSICGMIVKQLKDIHPGQLAMYRFLFIFVFSLPPVVRSGQDLTGPAGYRFLMLLRGLMATGLFLEFLAYRYLPLGEATVIVACTPVFVNVFGRIFFKESCGVVQSLTVLATVLGIMFVAGVPSMLFAGIKETYSPEFVTGIFAAIGATFFGTGRVLLLKKLSCVHTSVVMFHFGFVSVLNTALLTALAGDFRLHRCGLPAALIILLGMASYGGQLLLTLALKCEHAGPVATVRAATEMACAFLGQTLIFGEVSDVFGVAGAVLISCSVLVIGFRKWVLTAPAESRLFRFCGWLGI